MKKIALVIGILLFFIVGGYFLYGLLFGNNTLQKATKQTKINHEQKTISTSKTKSSNNSDSNTTSKYKYANPDTQSNFHRKPVKIKSVFSKEEQQKIENGTLYENKDIQANKKIEVEKSEIEMLKEKIKEPYYFVLLDWDFGGTNKNVLMISFQIYNLTNKNYSGLVNIKCKTMDEANNILGNVEDEFYITVGALSKRIYKNQIMGIVSPSSVKKVDCQFIYNKKEQTQTSSTQNKNVNVQDVNQGIKINQKEKTVKQPAEMGPPLDLFN